MVQEYVFVVLAVMLGISPADSVYNNSVLVALSGGAALSVSNVHVARYAPAKRSVHSGITPITPQVSLLREHSDT